MIFPCKYCKEIDQQSIPKLTTHSYAEKWSSDENKHWHECTVCNEQKDLADHIPGAEATVDAPQTCTTCGFELAPKLDEWPFILPWIIVGGFVLIAGGVAAFIIVKKKQK